MAEEPQLSDLQLAILRILWDRGQATASQVHEALLAQERALAPTTVATLLSRLEKRGILGRAALGRQYVYTPQIAEHEVRRSMLERVTDFFFGGDERALLSHLLGGRSVDRAELAQIKRMIAAKEGDRDDEE